MRSFLSLASLALFCAASPIAAQSIIQTPTSTIELIGLKRWTLAMITDSLAKYAPGDSLTGHACAQVLRLRLHFADASVESLRDFPEYKGKTYVAITVVEPQDSAKIHYKSFKDSLPVRAEWADAVAVLKSKQPLARRAMDSETFFADRWSPQDSAKFADVEPLHRLIVASRTPNALADAIKTLDTDGSISNRMIAAMILGRFADRDSAWWALVDAQRDPTGPVGSIARQTLDILTRRSPRTVDWRPAIDRVRYIMDGTNLFAFGTTLNALVATRVSPSLAPALLGGGGTIVRAKLRANERYMQSEAAAFVSYLSGLPAKGDVTRLEQWLDGVDRKAR